MFFIHIILFIFLHYKKLPYVFFSVPKTAWIGQMHECWNKSFNLFCLTLAHEKGISVIIYGTQVMPFIDLQFGLKNKKNLMSRILMTCLKMSKRSPDSNNCRHVQVCEFHFGCIIWIANLNQRKIMITKMLSKNHSVTHKVIFVYSSQFPIAHI